MNSQRANQPDRKYMADTSGRGNFQQEYVHEIPEQREFGQQQYQKSADNLPIYMDVNRPESNWMIRKPKNNVVQMIVCGNCAQTNYRSGNPIVIDDDGRNMFRYYLCDECVTRNKMIAKYQYDEFTAGKAKSQMSIKPFVQNEVQFLLY